MSPPLLGKGERQKPPLRAYTKLEFSIDRYGNRSIALSITEIKDKELAFRLLEKIVQIALEERIMEEAEGEQL